MASLGLEREVIDRGVYENTIARFRERDILLPTFSQLAEPSSIPDYIHEALAGVDPDAPHPLNLFRVHWYNALGRRNLAKSPDVLVLPQSLTGVLPKIALILGSRFPMIGAHKVLAAYGCLAPRLVTGQFDPTQHRAIWPSTGNYCRGGVAISRIMGCHGVAVLPEMMSQERFDWLSAWVLDPSDTITTIGSESNVKEIYDECARLDEDPRNIIFNQFCEFGNHLVHFLCTGRALEDVFEGMRAKDANLKLRAFVSATGSAGTIAAGDYLKEQYGSLNVAVEALECPTLLYNGFGEHNIQGIGDKHVPFIHNFNTTDIVTAVSEESSDSLNVLFNTDVGRSYLVNRRGVPPEIVEQLDELGLSGICNVVAAIKTAKYLELGPDDVIMTVATDSSRMYRSERVVGEETYFPNGFDVVAAGETYARFLLGAVTDHLVELTRLDRDRMFNLGYFTWVEQQGVSLEDFEARRNPQFWRDLRALVPIWDEMINEFNARVVR
jgi:cysteine synthase